MVKLTMETILGDPVARRMYQAMMPMDSCIDECGEHVLIERVKEARAGLYDLMQAALAERANGRGDGA